MVDKDWEQRLSKTLQTIEQNMADRKLSAVTKRTRGGVLDWIKIVTEDWMYLEKKKELYRHEQGNSKAHSQWAYNEYHGHHPLKVLLEDATKVMVQKLDNDGWTIEERIKWFHLTTTEWLYWTKGQETE